MGAHFAFFVLQCESVKEIALLIFSLGVDCKVYPDGDFRDEET
jgi:hypothetical protein